MTAPYGASNYMYIFNNGGETCLDLLLRQRPLKDDGGCSGSSAVMTAPRFRGLAAVLRAVSAAIGVAGSDGAEGRSSSASSSASEQPPRPPAG